MTGFPGGVLKVDEAGHLVRIGDYLLGGQGGLPFSLCADGVSAFGSPSVSGDDACRVLRWRSEADEMEITARFEFDAACGILSRRDTLRNLTDRPITLRKYAARFPFAAGEYEVYTQQALWCHESSGGAWTALNAGSIVLGSREGRWCEGATPFAVLRDAYARHALAFLVFPEGDWMMRFTRRNTGHSGSVPALTAEAGLSDDGLMLELAPGEDWTAPEVVIQILPGREAHSGAAAMNRYLNRRYPVDPARFPVVYNTWLDRMDKLDVPRLERQLEAAKNCGCEVFVVDYGWYEDLHSFTRLNDWDECTDRAFKGEMSRFADRVRATGLGFGFWVEAEFFFDRSRVVREHPEWFCASASPDIVWPKTWLPEVEDYLVDSLAAAIRRYRAVYVKNDMNHSQGAEPGRLNRYQKGLFRVFARLQTMFPETTFENCSSGGMRMAAGGMMEVFDNHFISDNASPLENLRMFQGALPRFAPGRIYHWFVGSELHQEAGRTDSFDPGMTLQPLSATWYRMQTEDLDFGLLCNLTGQIGFSCDLASFSPENQARIARYTAFFKQYRSELLRAEAHLLTPPENFEKRRGWVAFQLTDPETDTHFLYVFHSVCDGDAGRVFRPEGLDRAAWYEVREVFPEEVSGGEPIAGAELADAGLCVTLPVLQHHGWRGKLTIIRRAD